MPESSSSSMRKDFRIFREPGFLVALLLIGIFAAVAAYILIKASNDYGIPLREYWR